MADTGTSPPAGGSSPPGSGPAGEGPPGQPGQPSLPGLTSVEIRLGHGVLVMAASLLIFFLLYIILRELAAILRPLLVAVFLCYLIVPAHRWLVSHGLPRVLSYVVIVGAVVTTVYAVGQLARFSVGSMSNELPRTARSVQDRLNTSIAYWKERMAPLFPQEAPEELEAPEEEGALLPATPGALGAVLPPDPPAARMSPPGLEGIAVHPRPSRDGPPVRRAPVPRPSSEPAEAITLDQLRGQLVAWAQATLGTFVGFFAGAFVVLVYTIFLLLEVAGFQRRVVAAFGERNAERVMQVVGEINEAVARYITVKTFISVLVGAISAGILHLFGIQFALMWGVLTFFANFVPYVGSIFAVMFPIALSYVQYESLSVTFALLVLLTGAQQITGSFLEPRIMGERLGVSPLMILLSLAFWGYLWGVPGMILSSPLIVSTKIILDHIEHTKPLARLMSNR